MADDKDIRKIVEDLLKEGTARQQQLTQEEQSRLRSILKDYKDITQVQQELNGLINKGKENYEEVANKIKIAKENKDSLVDDEQIILELQEEQTQQLKNQFQINQKAYLQVLEQIKAKEKIIEKGGEEAEQAKKDLEYLEEKKTILKDITFDQGRQLEKAEREKKLKEGILSISKEMWEGAKQYTLELDKHIMNISKLNGGYAELGSNLREANRQIYQATTGTGVMFEEANAAFAGLSQNFIGLTTQSEKSIKDMVKGTAFLTKLGVDAGAAAKGFDSLVNSMGKTPEQAGKIQESFVQMAAKNRLALGAVSQAFAENSSRFVGYGEKMTKVLEGLSEQSLKTGVSMSSLVKIAQQFDTFEGAAKAVGNLNAMLGGDYLNSIELLTASDDERIKLLKEGVAASGMQWESMNRFQKMAVANAAGINDLNEAGKIFGQTSLQNTRQQEDAAKVQKTLAEQAESVSTSMDRMRSVLNGVVIALDPVVSLMSLLVDVLTYPAKKGGELGEEIGGWTGKIITVMGSLGSLLMAMAIKNKIFGGSFGFIRRGITSVIKKIPEYISSLFTKKAAEDATKTGSVVPSGPSSTVPSPTSPAATAGPGRFTSFINNINATNMLKAAGALLLFAAALLVLGFALQQFAAFAGDPNAGGGAAIAVLSIAALIGMSYALSKATPQISTGLIALVVLSASLLILALSLKMLSGVDWKLVAAIGVIILGLGLAIAGLGAAVSGPQGLLVAIGIGVLIGFAGALTILGIAIKTIIDSLKDSAPAFTNLGDSLTKLFAIKDLKQNFSDLESFFSQLSTIDVEPINNLANAIALLGENLQLLASMSPNISANVKGNVENIVTETAKTVNQVSEAVSSAATARTQSSLQTASNQAQQVLVPVQIYMDKKKVGEILNIEGIAKGIALDTLDGVGIGQSSEAVQSLLKGR